MNKVFWSYLLQMCLYIAFAMVGAWALIFTMWKIGALGETQASLIIWSFQMAFAGGLYMVLVPIAREVYKMSIRSHHYLSLGFGLVIVVFTRAQLLLYVNEAAAQEALHYLAMPLFLALVLHVLEKAKRKESPQVQKAEH